MQLIMEILNPPGYLPDGSRTRTFTSSGGLIGRNDGCEWCIPDPTKQLSGQHARISFHDGEFFLTDTSSNGTWQAEDGKRLVKDRPQRLKHHAVYRLSHFDVAVRLVQPPDLIALDVGRPMPANSVIQDDFLDTEPLKLLDRYDQEASDEDLSNVFEPTLAVDQQDDHAQVEALHMRIPTLTSLPSSDALPAPTSSSTFWRDFGATLGIDLMQLPENEREKLAINAAKLLRTCTLELQQCLHTCTQLKHEMLSGASDSYENDERPQDSDPNSCARLLGSPPAVGLEQIILGYRTLQHHQVATLAASRAALRSTLEQLSPAKVTLHFERSGHRRWFTAGERWRTYCHLHQNLGNNLHEQHLGSDFARSYAEQQRLLNTLDKLPSGAV
ncbi:hypothetical protein PS903_03843 [Pseudomonas fluorescens]|nr:hypothetical protein PS903_03843 [Pseudomonas fluorescens]